ncbi:MAG: hypothetical protein AAFQ22_00935 [Pseudomonadota bacterium]
MGAAEKTLFERVLQTISDRGFTYDPDTGQIGGVRCEAEGCGAIALQLSDDGSRLTCDACGERYDEPLEYLFRQPAIRRGPAQAMSDAHQIEAIDPDVRSVALSAQQDRVIESDPSEASRAVIPIGKSPTLHAVGVEDNPRSNSIGSHQRTHLGEKIIIALLALVFLGVGLLAAAMSGFANFQAFAGMVDDPFQSRVWGWTGIIACVCSFGGFTFAYWHGASRRFWEAGRAMVIALAGAATSLVGTQLYMQSEVAERESAAQAAAARASVLEAQIADWRTELDGIDPDVRSIEGLEAYIAEVERVGRTNERPYRAALDELGQARRRADLQARIATARGDFADLTVQAKGRGQLDDTGALRSWFIAGMLEVFSSQGTSIGFVALMILAGRRQPHSAEHQ